MPTTHCVSESFLWLWSFCIDSSSIAFPGSFSSDTLKNVFHSFSPSHKWDFGWIRAGVCLSTQPSARAVLGSPPCMWLLVCLDQDGADTENNILSNKGLHPWLWQAVWWIAFVKCLMCFHFPPGKLNIDFRLLKSKLILECWDARMYLEFSKIGTWLNAVEFLMCVFGLTQVVRRDLYLGRVLV